MKDLTERQKNILEIVIREYIENASPISSKYIEEEYDLGVSPATIRGELFELIERGYLCQLHTSSGRVPTDKGYRFFVDILIEKEIKRMEKKFVNEVCKMREEIEERSLFLRGLTRLLAHSSSSLAVSYFPQENIFLKEGFGDVFRDPEFEDIEKIRSFIEMVDDFENNIDSFLLEEKKEIMQVYIGKETPFSKRKDFSVLLSPCVFSKKRGLFAIMGPRRMSYEKNMALFENIIKLLE